MFGWESEQEGLRVAGRERRGVKMVTDASEIGKWVLENTPGLRKAQGKRRVRMKEKQAWRRRVPPKLEKEKEQSQPGDRGGQ